MNYQINNTSTELSFSASCRDFNADYNYIGFGYIRHSDKFIVSSSSYAGCVAILLLDPSIQIEIDNDIIKIIT